VLSPLVDYPNSGPSAHLCNLVHMTNILCILLSCCFCEEVFQHLPSEQPFLSYKILVACSFSVSKGWCPDVEPLNYASLEKMGWCVPSRFVTICPHFSGRTILEMDHPKGTSSRDALSRDAKFRNATSRYQRVFLPQCFLTRYDTDIYPSPI
jgi:hypothetical protein